MRALLPKCGFFGAVGGQTVLGARAELGFRWVSARHPPLPTRDVVDPGEKKKEEKPGDGDRDVPLPIGSAGKLRHGGVVAPALFAGWVLRCAGGPPAWWVLSILPSAGWGRSWAAPSCWGAGAGVPGPLGGCGGSAWF